MDPSRKYALRVTAGPEYGTHTPVPVNSGQPLTIATDAATVTLSVHIKSYRAPPQPRWPPGPGGPPTGNANSPPPADGDYFKTAAHASARYGLRFSLTPRRPLRGADVLLGNDFDAPVRALLPPGFGAALRVVGTLVDPGLEGDPYAERPFLYGALGSSANVLRFGPVVGGGAAQKEEGRGAMELDLQEGAEGAEAQEERRRAGLPDGAAARRKWFLEGRNREGFVFEEGRRYDFDFFNGYLDFNGGMAFFAKLVSDLRFQISL
jgi:hypothetical protein